MGTSEIPGTNVIYLRVNHDLHKEMRKFAKANNVSMTALGNRALTYYLTEKCNIKLKNPGVIP